MEAANVRKIRCRRCHKLIDVGDRYCRYCGTPTDASLDSPVAATAVTSSPSPGPMRVSDNPWVMLVLLFLILGPLALPMLWRGRAFSTTGKGILTAILLGIVVALVLTAWYVLTQLLDPDAQLRRALQPG